ncbi:MAG: cobalamin-binding protein [Anaerolineae bacterium]|nr:cobalamin-binding protein [Anaerolineae bacterium]
MKTGNDPAELIAAIADLEEERALALVRQRLHAGDDPLRIIEDCQAGLKQVGERYEQHQYFLSGLVMGGEIFRGAMELVQPVVERHVSGGASGHVLLGTVEGDIHDLGKNIVTMLLTCHKFTVCDLGVDVPPDEFAARAREEEPDLIGISGLLTSSYDSMRDTIALLRSEGYRGPIVIGGGQLSEEVCEYVGADHWTTDAVPGVELCRRLVAEANR